MSGGHNLSSDDLARFAKIGVDEALLQEAGVSRVTDREARELYGMRFKGDLAGIYFPYHDPLTGHRVTGRLRRDKPETDSQGKAQNKYICAYGDNRHLCFPPGAGMLLKDVSVPVIFVESEKSALALATLAARQGRRFLAIATGGCWGWSGKTGIKSGPSGEREEVRGPLSDLCLIALEQERLAIIVFDSNTATNPHVMVARWEFAQALADFGAKVQFVDVPSEGGVNGPDDLICTAGDESMLKLLDAARPFAKQAEADAERALAALSNSCDLHKRDEAIDAIARVADFNHQRVFALRAAKALGERSAKALEREIGNRAKGLRVAREQAKEAVRQGRLLQMEVEPAALIEDLERFFSKRLGLPEGAPLILALFTLNTYLFDLFDTTPYLQIDSAIGGCGKSTLLDHLKATCCRAYLGCDPSEATLFRRIDRDRPTWLLDEASVVRGHEERARMIRAILDAGYRKGATVSRCEGEDNHLRDFAVYCPKAFALVGSLRGTLLDRCIVLHLQKTPGLPKTKVKLLKRDSGPLREQLEAYAAQYCGELQRLDDNEPDEGYWMQLDGREEELWGPLLMHAKLAGEDTEKRALAVAFNYSRQKGQLAQEEDQTVTLATELLEVLSEMAVETISPGELQGLLAEKEAWGAKLAALKNDKARPCAVGAFLKNFRLPSRTRGNQGTRYSVAEAVEIVRRHLPPIVMPHATQADKMPGSRVASPENGDATPHASKSSDPLGVAAKGTGVTSGEKGLATEESRMNAEQVASDKSNARGKKGILKF